MSWRKGFDVTEYLDTFSGYCQQALEAEATGVLLVDKDGSALNDGATDDTARELQRLQLKLNEGPIVDVLAQAQPLVVGDITSYAETWPEYVSRSTEADLVAGVVVPILDHDAEAVGAVSVAMPPDEQVDAKDVRLLQVAAAQVSDMMALHEHIGHLQCALDSRVHLEQGKGAVARAFGLSPDLAFQVIRQTSKFYRRPKRSLIDDVLVDPGGDTEQLLRANIVEALKKTEEGRAWLAARSMK